MLKVDFLMYYFSKKYSIVFFTAYKDDAFKSSAYMLQSGQQIIGILLQFVSEIFMHQ